MKNLLHTIENVRKRQTSACPSATRADDVRDNRAATSVQRSRLSRFWRRVILGVALLVGLFLIYRLLWLTAWVLPYGLISSYLAARLPMLASWQIETMALLLTALVLVQVGTILSFVFFGKHKRLMLYFALALALMHGAIGWYGYGRLAVDESGHVRVRVVEGTDGQLKVIEHDYDPETGRAARWATENDLVMLDLERRGIRVKRVGAAGPFRSPQGTIIVYYTRRSDGRIVLYTGPRSSEVNGDMGLANNEIIREFLAQQNAAGRKP
ncbi:MAG TPA: hypothetical protein VJ464_23880 [Blastocatellia bacterium]|nr:hypothetical protein [Blastocatellia bacterium]